MKDIFDNGLFPSEAIVPRGPQYREVNREITQAMRDSTIQKRNVKYSELAGIKTIRIHDFRHNHASLPANEGINIQEIARRLGRSKIEIT